MREFLLVFFVAMLAGCGGADTIDFAEDSPSCLSAIDHALDQSCAFSGPGTTQDVVEACLIWQVQSAAIGGNCPERLYNWLWCMATITGPTECESCNDELGLLTVCK